MSVQKDILVSVVIPTYSRNDALERAVKCILAQTHQNLDIIVVDDNPQDSEYRRAAENIMAKFKEDARVRYIQNPQNLGGSGARNVGIEAARGEYIAFLDDDDIYYPEKIEKQLAVFCQSDSDKLALVYCDVEHVNQNGDVDCVVRQRHRGNCIYEAIVDDCIASTSLWLARKSALQDVGNFSIVPCKQDSTVIIKLLQKGYEVDYVPEVLCKYSNFVGVTRISFGPRKIEGEKLFYDLCKTNYEKFTQKQIKKIEYSFAKRLYILYSYKRDRDLVASGQEKKKMWKNDFCASFFFFAKRKIKSIIKK